MCDSKLPEGSPPAPQNGLSLPGPPELIPHVYRIPNEILGLIFLFNATWTKGKMDNPRRTTMATSQVCQRWRNAALSYPGLWSRIMNFQKDPIPLLIELLKRSDPVRIDVGKDDQQVTLGWGDGRKISEILTANTQRIRTFNVEMGQADLEHLAKMFIQYPAPHLEFLGLNVNGDLGELLFQARVPALRRLHLIDCDIHKIPFMTSKVPFFATLTELSIKDVTNISISTWVLILLQTPSLRWLSILFSISPTGEIQSQRNKAPLPELLMLSLAGRFNDCVSLVDHIVAPPLCSLRLECTSMPVGRELDQALDIAEQWTSQCSLRNVIARRLCVVAIVRSSLIVGNPNWFGALNTWGTCEAASLRSKCHIDGTSMLSFHFTWESSEEVSSCSHRLVSCFRPIYSVAESLILWVDDDMFSFHENSLAIEEILPSFYNLRVLHVTEESVVHIINLLYNPELQKGSSDILLPSLKTIYFMDPRFGENDKCFDTLLSVVQQRRRIHSPIQNINIVCDEGEDPRLHMNQRQQDVLTEHGVRIELSALTMSEEFRFLLDHCASG
ncbi:uncharacterized protein LACBIDRAFT_321507 [Laccaria bicolor S238N-H82]|uniref:Predicted protein n=1 Tax=Laccaria bicolor (strain S238N-H82 / ATCC MYA-4686) TaxID=486041 RepID=B0CT44_LACBS|nr:uncharacterized protein LACBIDRAFT_321507 [Laccaria bicolor S238N-H82]EDR14440.1 predicted protein [Laccaria bicolor S238N-H82]|eukprot:XP_001874999.1 predicted protein [Laccaria bicolor S238N-H82]